MSEDKIFEASIPHASGPDITITIRLTGDACDISVRPRETFATPAQSNDALGVFLSERCQRAPAGIGFTSHYECRADKFRQEFTGFCRLREVPVMAPRTLGANLKKRGINSRKSAGRTIYCGLKLLPVAL